MKRKSYRKEFKARVALEAIKGQKMLREIASEYGVHPNQISNWKKRLTSRASDVFSRGKDRASERFEFERDRLYQKVG